jgi:hypothetical protein
MLRTKHRKHQKRKHNYAIIGVSARGDDCVVVDYQSRENGSIYRAFWEVGMYVHIDFHYNPETRNTAGTTITPLL